MIRRIIAFFIILVANIILLGHAIIPHYHHKSEVCIGNSHCNTNNAPHTHSDVENNHEHDSNEKEYCVLKEVVIIPSNRIIKEFKSLNLFIKNFEFDGFHILLFKNEIESFTSIFINKALDPLITSFHTNYVNTVLGLRGPPIV